MSIVIDARTGQRFAHGGKIISLCAEAWNSSKADTPAGRLDAMDEMRQRMDAKSIQNHLANRADALTSGTASFPRDFEHIYQEVLTEKRRPLNSERLFQTDTRVPLGTKTHTVRIDLGTGDAKIWRGGDDIPVVGTQRKEEQFEMVYIVSAVETNLFETWSDSFEGRNTFASDTRMAIRAIREKMNDIAFFGAAPSKVHGFTNYPGMATSVSPLVWSASGSTPTQIVAALNAAANFASEASGGAMQPNRMATSLQVRNFLMQTNMGNGTDTTIGQFFLNGNEFINSIESAQELEGIGPVSEDGVAFYDDSLESTANVIIQPPTALPAHQIDSLRGQTVYVAAVGGIVQRFAGNNHLLLAARS